MLCAPCGVGVRCDVHGTPGVVDPLVDRAALADWENTLRATPAGDHLPESPAGTIIR